MKALACVIVSIILQTTKIHTTFATTASSNENGKHSLSNNNKMDANDDNENYHEQEENENLSNNPQDREETTLQLPSSSSSSRDEKESIPQLKFGEVLRLDKLGPIILNKDGTMRRIDNWDTLTKVEQDVSWRRIKKRNEERRRMLLEKEVDMEL